MAMAALAALQIFLRSWLGLAFLTAGASKVGDPATLQAVRSPRAPEPHRGVRGGRLASALAAAGFVTLGAVELAVGALVLAGFRGLWAAGATTLLLVLFTAHLARLVIRRQRRRCRCGGLLGDHLVTQALLLRNGVLLAGAAVLLATELALASDLSLDCALAGCLPWQQLRPPAGPSAAGASLAGSVVGLALTAASLHLYRRHRPRDDAESEPVSQQP